MLLLGIAVPKTRTASLLHGIAFGTRPLTSLVAYVMSSLLLAWQPLGMVRTSWRNIIKHPRLGQNNQLPLDDIDVYSRFCTTCSHTRSSCCWGGDPVNIRTIYATNVLPTTTVGWVYNYADFLHNLLTNAGEKLNDLHDLV